MQAWRSILPIVLVSLTGCSSATDAPVLPADLETDWTFMHDLTPRGYDAAFTEMALRIDGRLDDAAWENAVWTETFVDIEGPRKPDPTYATRVKMLWDSTYLYVGVKMDEPHIWGYNTEKNTPIYQFDNDFEIFVDPDGDRHNYYEFEGNVLNTIWELTLPKPYKDSGSPEDPTNMSGLLSAVFAEGTINDPSDLDEYWTYEFALPWTGFERYDAPSLPPETGDEWRINFSRVQWQHVVEGDQYQKKEGTPENNWVWSPQGIIAMHCPEKWGILRFTGPNESATYLYESPLLDVENYLQAIYYRQKKYAELYQRFAGDVSLLGLLETEIPGSIKSLMMDTTESGFEVKVLLSEQLSGYQSVSIDQDSHLVRE